MDFSRLEIEKHADKHRAKEIAQSKGGTIKHEYSLIKGFTYVTLVLVSDMTDQPVSSTQTTTSTSFRAATMCMLSRMLRSRHNRRGACVK